MPSVASAKSASKAGIATTTHGDRHIPSSTRPDGSTRKEIRVRPGYQPPEDVEVYKNKTAHAYQTKGPQAIPGASFVELPQDRKKQKATKPKDVSKPVAELPAELDLDPEAEKEKEAKKLTKKLRQAKDLQSKKESGAALLPEQFAKLIKINELIRQLEQLGFDSEGQKKP